MLKPRTERRSWLYSRCPLSVHAELLSASYTSYDVTPPNGLRLFL